MPHSYDLRNVQIGLKVPDRSIRDLLRGLLARIGVREIRDLPEGDGPLAFASLDPDLVLVDVDLLEDDGRPFFSALRHGQGGVSPFVCAMALKSNPTPAFLARVTAGGADDLLVKPVSPLQLQDRIALLVEHRRGFVVTSDYVGPDRRRALRDGEPAAARGSGRPIPLIDVPNTLRQKVLGTWTADRVVQETVSALAAVNVQKIIRHGFQVAFLAEYALPGLLTEGAGKADALAHLQRIPAVLEDLLRRWPEEENRHLVQEYADALSLRIDGILADPEPGLASPGPVKAAAFGIMALCAQSSDLVSLETEVAGAVSAYRQRLDEMVQAKARAAALPAPSW